MIISAQWQILNTDYPGRQVIVATTNLRHLRRFTNAREWQDIK